MTEGISSLQINNPRENITLLCSTCKTVWPKLRFTFDVLVTGRQYTGKIRGLFLFAKAFVIIGIKKCVNVD
jgi:hypothetical protein